MKGHWYARNAVLFLDELFGQRPAGAGGSSGFSGLQRCTKKNGKAYLLVTGCTLRRAGWALSGRHAARSWCKESRYGEEGSRRATRASLRLLLHVHYFNQIAHTCVLFWRLTPVLDGSRALRGHTFRFGLQRGRGKQVAWGNDSAVVPGRGSASGSSAWTSGYGWRGEKTAVWRP